MHELRLHWGRQLAGRFDDDTLFLSAKDRLYIASTLYYEAFDKLIDGIPDCSQ